jgi:hypothetical protein
LQGIRKASQKKKTEAQLHYSDKLIRSSVGEKTVKRGCIQRKWKKKKEAEDLA